MHLEHRTKKPERTGHHTPLLFVHGAWHGSWCWDEGFLDYFADRGFTAHALSLRGHGASEGRDALRRTRMADYVADVATIAERLPTPPIVIGHSMGGAVVQQYLEEHAAPAGVLMASLPPTGVLPTTARLHGRHPWRSLRMHLTLNLYPLVETLDVARGLFFSEKMPVVDVKRHHARLQNESYRAFLDMLALDLPRPDAVRAPLLVLGAERDTVFLPRQVRATAEAYDTHAMMFPDMAHDMMLEPGWESVAQAIVTWIEAGCPAGRTS